MNYFKDVPQNKEYDAEIYGAANYNYNGPRAYPDDLENLLLFIRTKCVPLRSRNKTTVSSHFSKP